MADDTNLILQRIESLDENMKEHVSMCRALCTTRIDNAEAIANKAHSRLDEHGLSIDCLKSWKNRNLGAISVIVFVLVAMGIKLKIIGM